MGRVNLKDIKGRITQYESAVYQILFTQRYGNLKCESNESEFKLKLSI
jgi:hypothetical protein